MSVILTIPGDPPPGINEQERMHWGERKRLREEWMSKAWCAWWEAGRLKFKRPRITCRLYYRANRKRDIDNLGAAIKPLLDGLKGYAFADDDAGTIGLMPVEIYVDPARSRVEIEIEEVIGQ